MLVSSSQSQLEYVKWQELTSPRVRPMKLLISLLVTPGVKTSKRVTVDMELSCIPEFNIWGYQLPQQQDQVNNSSSQAVLVHSSTRCQAGYISWFDIKSEGPYNLNKVVAASSLVSYPLATVDGL